MKKQKISNRSFNRTSKRFLKLVIDLIQNSNLNSRHESEVIFNITKNIENLNLKYRKNPFKYKSSFDFKSDTFSNVSLEMRYIRVQYIFDKHLTFKLLTKSDIFNESELTEFIESNNRKPNSGNRYIRKIKFVLK